MVSYRKITKKSFRLTNHEMFILSKDKNNIKISGMDFKLNKRAKLAAWYLNLNTLLALIPMNDCFSILHQPLNFESLCILCVKWYILERIVWTNNFFKWRLIFLIHIACPIELWKIVCYYDCHSCGIWIGRMLIFAVFAQTGSTYVVE